MKRITIAAVIAVVVETLLCLVFSQFGRISLIRSEDTNFIGSLIAFFHMPGLILSEWVHVPNRAAMPFIIFIGGVQWFLLAMFFIWVWQRPRGQNAP